jgi:hypothetical protein
MTYREFIIIGGSNLDGLIGSIKEPIRQQPNCEIDRNIPGFITNNKYVWFPFQANGQGHPVKVGVWAVILSMGRTERNWDDWILKGFATEGGKSGKIYTFQATYNPHKRGGVMRIGGEVYKSEGFPAEPSFNYDHRFTL